MYPIQLRFNSFHVNWKSTSISSLFLPFLWDSTISTLKIDFNFLQINWRHRMTCVSYFSSNALERLSEFALVLLCILLNSFFSLFLCSSFLSFYVDDIFFSCNLTRNNSLCCSMFSIIFLSRDFFSQSRRRRRHHHHSSVGELGWNFFLLFFGFFNDVNFLINFYIFLFIIN